VARAVLKAAPLLVLDEVRTGGGGGPPPGRGFCANAPPPPPSAVSVLAINRIHYRTRNVPWQSFNHQPETAPGLV